MNNEYEIARDIAKKLRDIDAEFQNVDVYLTLRKTLSL